MIFTRDCVTRENYWRITPLVTRNIVINGSPYTIPYVRLTGMISYTSINANSIYLYEPKEYISPGLLVTFIFYSMFSFGVDSAVARYPLYSVHVQYSQGISVIASSVEWSSVVYHQIWKIMCCMSGRAALHFWMLDNIQAFKSVFCWSQWGSIYAMSES